MILSYPFVLDRSIVPLFQPRSEPDIAAYVPSGLGHGQIGDLIGTVAINVAFIR
jgi:hypothetical protein